MIKNKIIWLQYVRAIACLLVILLHISSNYVNEFGVVGYGYWSISNAIDSFSRVCVPLFFMISGYLFFGDKSPKAKNFFKLFSALIFYSVLAYLFYFSASIAFPSLTISEKYNFFSSPAIYHLWFFYPLILVYLIAVIVNVRKVSTSASFIIVSIFFIFLNNSSIENVKSVFNVNLNNLFAVNSEFFFYVLYSIMGAIFRDLKYVFISKKTASLIGVATFMLSCTAITVITKSTSTDNNEFYSGVYTYTSPLVFMAATSLFLFFHSASERLKDSKIINIIADNSLGIYGIHIFILICIQKIFRYQLHNPAYIVPIMFVIILTISLSFSILIKKIDKHGFVS
ncbi:hypothetical protein EYZ01_17700 [Hafnia alvei]|uniref:acyltransferase n=1 Tax=Hafnia alvei TaxID=569 RepID=UPI0010335C67|nr:acyltransferase family protein [Hafnia alvei]TBL37350.1 hypothetical protein EYZ01_17700 [Hafnia alvei]